MAAKRMDNMEEQIGEIGGEISSFKERFEAIEAKLGGIDKLKEQIGGIQDLLKQLITERQKEGNSPNPNPNSHPDERDEARRERAGDQFRGKEVAGHGGGEQGATGSRETLRPRALGLPTNNRGRGRPVRAMPDEFQPPRGPRGNGGPSHGQWEADRRGNPWGAAGYAQEEEDEPLAWEGGWNYDGLRPWERPPDQRQGGVGGGRGYGRTDWGSRKLKMPMFDGEDPYGWVYRVERYFSVLGMTEEEKMQAAPICLKGRALAWFQWADERQNI